MCIRDRVSTQSTWGNSNTLYLRRMDEQLEKWSSCELSFQWQKMLRFHFFGKLELDRAFAIVSAFARNRTLRQIGRSYRREGLRKRALLLCPVDLDIIKNKLVAISEAHQEFWTEHGYSWATNENMKDKKYQHNSRPENLYRFLIYRYLHKVVQTRA
eukprot:TRINITY_DN65686_c0_g1_i1.p1 TRINITY_DN65686_c0_g1~~TRINITY_DN65686_c0_g1_i1.p1  ORF type:complete len:157 (+),score=13.99 TRINITY_DN65686_c0_g1_i1:106-576(+)